MRFLWWVIRHPIVNAKIAIDVVRGCRDIDMETYQCRFCKVQYRIVSAAEYGGNLKSLSAPENDNLTKSNKRSA